LGSSQFGLVSFVTTVQVSLGLLEAGFAQVSAREFAVLTSKESPDNSSIAYYLKKFEEIFWGISFISAIATVCMSSFLAEHWLMTNTETERSLSIDAVIGASLIFAVQFPSSLYRSYLVGSQQQIKLNVISSTSILIRHGGGILILLKSPTLHTYLAWQFLSFAAETFVRRFVSWKSVTCSPHATIEKKQNFKCVVRDCIGMFAAVIVGGITTQFDKIILSGTIPIEEFGYYSIASTVSIGIVAAIQPAVQAISPLMMQSAGSKESLRLHSIKLAKLISICIVSLAFGYLFLGRTLLAIWLQNHEAVSYIFPILSMLLVGSALNAYYHIGYYNWLAEGRAGVIFNVNAASFLLTICVTPILIARMGAMGATFAFVAMNLLGLVLSLGWVRRSVN